MKPALPHQPLLLRILHGLTGIFAIAAILTAFWTYNTYDGRWGTIPLPRFEAIEDIHGTFGLYTLLVYPLFVLYAFRRGQKRLLQPQALEKLYRGRWPLAGRRPSPLAGRIPSPFWWSVLHQLTNTLTILALVFALFSGKMMDSN